MKKFVLMLSIFWGSYSVLGAELNVFDEATQLGTIAGLAEACGETKKVETYELISARLIANKANSEEQEMEGYQRYAAEKLRASREHKKSPKLTCGEILNRFQKLPLFKSVVYKDGSLKFYDGTYYPAKGIYVKKQ